MEKAQQTQQQLQIEAEKKMQEEELENREDLQTHEKEKITLKETLAAQSAAELQLLKNEVEILKTNKEV